MSSAIPASHTSSPPQPGLLWEQASCAVCGSSEQDFVIEVSNFMYNRPGSAKIVRCKHCQHLYQSPRPTRDTIGACYTSDYGPHTHNIPRVQTSGHTDKESNENPGAKPWHLTPLVRSIPGLKACYRWLSAGSDAPVPVLPSEDAKVLEIGCGSGGYLQRLLDAGWQAEGIEFAPGPAARCRELGLKVHTTGIEDADLESRTYDLVVAWMVIEHLHDPGSVLRQIAGLLKPSGVLMFSVPNTDCWELKAFGKYNFILNEPTHLQHFSVNTISKLLSASGFQVDSIEYQNNVYNLVGSFGLWLQSRFPKRGLGARLLHFCDNPSMWGRLALAPLAKLLAAAKQSGRITIIAKRIER